jgi:hypothetical protein
VGGTLHLQMCLGADKENENRRQRTSRQANVRQTHMSVAWIGAYSNKYQESQPKKLGVGWTEAEIISRQINIVKLNPSNRQWVMEEGSDHLHKTAGDVSSQAE